MAVRFSPGTGRDHHPVEGEAAGAAVGAGDAHELAQTLAEFSAENRDCNFKLMAREILGFLHNIVEADGRLNRRDEQAIANIEAIFDSANRISIRKKLRAGLSSIRQKTRRIFSRRNSSR
jgi:hypothetical protein